MSNINPTNIGTANSRFRGCIHPSKNFDIVSLMEASERFGFVVDVRGPYPIMVRGVMACVYTTHRDMLHFISVSSEVK